MNALSGKRPPIRSFRAAQVKVLIAALRKACPALFIKEDCDIGA